jgi:hypothetical protein
MNVLIKKVLFEKAREVPLKNLITTFKTAENPIVNKSKQPDDPAADSNYKQLSGKEQKIEFLNSKLINYTQGWNTINASVCQNASNNIHIQPVTGKKSNPTNLKNRLFSRFLTHFKLFRRLFLFEM